MRKSIILVCLLIGLFLSPFSVVAIQGDSMEPTIPNDALLITYETQDVGNNDIITFYSEQTDSYVTHRIIETTEQGHFITLGDNNAVTDQEIGFTPVTPQQVDSRAVLVNDTPLFIPYLGGLLLLFQANLIPFTALLLAAGTLLYLIQQRVERNRLYSQLVAKDVFQPIFIITIILLTIVFIVNATVLTIPFVYTASEDTAQQQYVVSVNEDAPTEEIVINSTESWYTNEIYIVTGFEPLDITREQDQTRITALLPRQDNPGSLQTTVTVYKVPALLPQQTAQELAYISPILPIFLSTLIILAPFYLFYYLYMGPKTPIRNPRITRLLERWE